MRNHPPSITEQERDQEFFDSVTEDEIMHHWRSIRSKGLSEDRKSTRLNSSHRL